MKIWVNRTQKTCDKCEDLVRRRNLVSSGYGSKTANVMFIGQCPGIKGCNVTGIPFTKDRSGRFFQELLVKFGFDFNEVYTTNLVKCCPNDGKKNLNPTKTHVNNCLKYLEKEIAIINPDVIVTIGAYARDNLPETDAKLIHVWHPAYVLRSPDKKELYFEQWQEVVKFK